MVPISLTLTGAQHTALKTHLFPGDGLEAVAFVLCGRRDGDRRHRLLAQEIVPVPYAACRRAVDSVTWDSDVLAEPLERAAAAGLSVMKVHSHPTGYASFSTTDDASDAQLLPMVHGWVGHDVPHGSVVMVPDGRMFGRTLPRTGAGHLAALERISVVGDDIVIWRDPGADAHPADYLESQTQAFGEGTTSIMRGLSIGFVGCSGTGGPSIEMVLRLGAHEIVMVDPDTMQIRNINRIPNSTMEDVRQRRHKVHVMRDAIRRVDTGSVAVAIAKDLWTQEAILALAQCDVVFGCMDTVDGRFLLNVLATNYLIPYFDIGISLENHLAGPRKGTIREVCGTVHYLQPGRSSLMTRGLFTMQDVAAAGLRRRDPAAFAQQVRDKYIKGAQVNRPAVVSVNTFAASLAVNELLARLHPYREAPNAAHASVCFSLASMELICEPESEPCAVLARDVGRGDRTPLLGLLDFAEAA